MGAEIDRLDIEVETQATKANNALDKLVGKLERLAGSLGSIKSDGLTEFASGVGNLSTAAKNMAGVKVSNFSTIANGVKKLTQLDTAQMISTADGIEHLVQELGGISGLNFDASGIVAVANSLAKLGGVKATTGTQNLQTVKDDLAKFVTGMNSIGSLNFDIENLLGLIDSISKLGGKKATQAAQNLPPISAQLQNLVRQMNNIESLKFDVSGVESLVSSVSKLGYKSAVTATANIPNLTKALLDMMNVLSKAPAVSSNLIDMTTALAGLANQGSKVGSSAKSVTNNLNGYSASVQRASKSSKGLASIFGKLYANFFWVKRGADKLWKSITTSMDYVETLNYFDAAFGQVAESAVSQWEDAGYDSADAYYKSFSERAKQVTSKMTGFAVKDDGTLQATGQPSLGIDPEKLMNYQATFGQMSSSMGVTAETALKLSQALTEIGGDLASVKNLDFDKVWNDMASGLAGMSRTLDKYGVNIRNVNLQQKLNELGIQANITALNQNDKALLRAIILLDSTRYAWGDLADTINQPANQLRLIESNFQNLSRTIGNLFLPAVSNVLPYVNAMVIALQRLATWIGNLLGIDLSKVTKSVGESSFDFVSIADEAENATEAVNQLQKGIRKFDELDVINTSSGSGSGSGGGIGSGLLDDAFNKSYEEYQKAWDEAFANMENKAQDLADKIDKFFEPVKNIFTDFFEGDFFAAGQDTSKLVSGIFNWMADGIRKVDWKDIGNNIGEFLNGVEWTEVFMSVGNFFESAIDSAVELWKESFSAAPIETGIITAIGVLKFTGVGKIIWEKISEDFSATVFGKKIGITPTIEIAAITWIVGFNVGKSLGKALFPDDKEYYENFTWFGDGGFFDSITDDLGVSLAAAEDMMTDFENNPVIATLANIIAGPFVSLPVQIDKFVTPKIEEWYENDVQPLFSKENWQKLGENVKTSLIDKWDEFKENWQNTGIYRWFTDDVSPWLSKEKWETLGDNAKEALSDKWDEFTSWWEDIGFSKWWDDVSSHFTKEAWTWDGIEQGLTQAWNNAVAGIKKIWNGLADWLNDKLNFSWDGIDIAGKEIIPSGEINLGKIPKFENGGYVPTRFSMFMAGENGKPELMFTKGGRTAVAPTSEITGIISAIVNSTQQEMEMLRQQNELLRGILNKEYGISTDDIGKSARQYAHEYYRRTGEPAYL